MSGRPRTWAWAPVLVYMALIFMLSAQSRLPTAPGVLGWDKLQHYLAYVGMGLLLFRGVRLRPIAPIGPYLQALVIGALYAASDEYHQSFVPGRNMDFRDWIADVIGVLAALAVVYIVRRYFAKRET